MKVSNARTKKSVLLSRPSQLFGQDKTILDEGFAGDVIGLNNPGSFAIGDTLYVGKRRALPPIPTFSPELFAYLRNTDTGKYKQFQKGVQELLGEGAVQVMYSRDAIKQDPILAAVGQLQFEVVQARMKQEYGGGDDAREPALRGGAVGGGRMGRRRRRGAHLQRAVREGHLGAARVAVQERVERRAARRGYSGDWRTLAVLHPARRGGLTRLSVHTRADEDQTRARRIS